MPSPRPGIWAFPSSRSSGRKCSTTPIQRRGESSTCWRAVAFSISTTPTCAARFVCRSSSNCEGGPLVVCCTFCLPVVFKLRRRPSIVIYYSLEDIPFYGPFDVEMNRYVNDLVDLVIFPEENRAVKEVRRFGFSGASKAVLFNCADVNAEEPEKNFAPQRNGRVIYAGTIDQVQTFANTTRSRQPAAFRSIYSAPSAPRPRSKSKTSSALCADRSDTTAILGTRKSPRRARSMPIASLPGTLRSKTSSTPLRTNSLSRSPMAFLRLQPRILSAR